MRRSFTRFWYSSTCKHWLSFCSCKCFSIWADGRRAGRGEDLRGECTLEWPGSRQANPEGHRVRTVAGGLGEGGWGAIRDRSWVWVSFWSDENVLKLVVMFPNFVNMLKTTDFTL